MKKNNLFMLFTSILNLGLCLLLLFLCVPEKVAMFVDFNEKIILIVSKWFMLFGAITPLVLSIINLFMKNKPKTTFILKTFIILFVYENMLAFAYFSNVTGFELGEVSQIPLALSVFMPISAFATIAAIKLKRAPFKSKLGIKSKHSTKTEFIWKQTHLYASDIFFAYGVISFLISIIFIFTKHSYILLAIDVLGYVFCWLFANKQAKDMAEKYTDMENRKLKQEQKNKE